MSVLIFLISTFSLLVLFNLIRGKKLNHIHTQDNILIACLYLSVFSYAIYKTIVTGSLTHLIYMLVFAFAGLVIEYFGDWIWREVFGTRMYQYYKLKLFGFTSWAILPMWACAGNFFLSIWTRLDLSKYELNWYEFAKSFLAFGVFSSLVVLLIFSLWEYFVLHKLISLRGFKGVKYLALVALLWGGIIGAIIDLNALYLLPYFMYACLIGTLLEGLVGQGLRLLFGEYIWYYNRLKLFGGATSLLVLPLWSAPAAIALVLIPMLF